MTNRQSLLIVNVLSHFKTQQNVLIENKKVMLSRTEKAEEPIKMVRYGKVKLKYVWSRESWREMTISSHD